MKSLACLFAALVIVASPLPARPQALRTAQTSPRLSASIERAGDQLRLVLTNPSETRTFQGVASISFDGSTGAAIRLSFTLAPEETRRLPLPDSATLSGQYALSVYDQSGTVVLYKIAMPVAGESFTQKAVSEQTVQVGDAGVVKVSVRVPRSLANSEAEVSLPDEAEPILVAFVIESATPINDARFTLSGRDFERRQPVTAQGRTEVEFKLPESLSERQFNYTLIAERGALLARGKVDLDQLAASDAISASELTFDRPAYTPGDAVRATIELLGDAPHGYRLEVTVQEGGENSLFKDARKGVNNAGKSRHEFLFDLPRELKGPITFAFKVFGGQTGLRFDSGVRQIPITEAQPAKTADGKRIAP